MKKFNFAGKAIVIVITAAFCLITISQGTAFAQRSNPTSVDRRVDQLNRQGEQYSRDELRREFKGKKRPIDKKQALALAAQIKDDFEALQASYNQIVLAFNSRKAVRYDSVLEPLTEIKEHASRLKANLSLPQPADGPGKVEPAVSNPAEDRLVTLQKHVYNFLTNPLFEASRVFEIEQARKASQDLDKVIELSEDVIELARQSTKSH